ncbi:MAG: site-2 protease family protein [Longispora sp.]|nr:site-2 protease family protein [Longispora sp. (in: high G+C Gram-positive bacteria)]
MAFALGVALFALGIFVSVCLHEAGHMWTAKKFGMKVTRYFAGFGPTLWSFRRGETEYGLKAVPLGGFVKIVGMTPLEEDEASLSEADKKRVFWRKPLWQRTVVLSAGSITHFILAFLLLWIAAMFVGLPNPALADVRSAEDVDKQPAVIAVLPCVPVNELATECAPTDPESPGKIAGLQNFDRIVAVNGTTIATYGDFRKAIRATPAGSALNLTVNRGNNIQSVTATPTQVERTAPDGTKQLTAVLGITWTTNEPNTVTYNPATAVGAAGAFFGDTLGNTFLAMKKLPEKLPKLWEALGGGERDVETPISVVGASRIGGELADRGIWPPFFWLLASLNVFVGIFNLLPLLPLDGGHIAIAWFERLRSTWAARRGKPDPGRVDYAKLMPVTYAVIIIFGAFTLLTVGADIVNPITLPW